MQDKGHRLKWCFLVWFKPHHQSPPQHPLCSHADPWECTVQDCKLICTHTHTHGACFMWKLLFLRGFVWFLKLSLSCYITVYINNDPAFRLDENTGCSLKFVKMCIRFRLTPHCVLTETSWVWKCHPSMTAYTDVQDASGLCCAHVHTQCGFTEKCFLGHSKILWHLSDQWAIFSSFETAQKVLRSGIFYQNGFIKNYGQLEKILTFLCWEKKSGVYSIMLT